MLEFLSELIKMKKLLFTGLFLCFCLFTTSYAQDYKGSIFTGGNLNVSGYFNSDDTYESERFSFSITPNVGGFISKNFALGGTLSYRWSQQFSGNVYNDNDNKEFANTIGASVYARYYKFFGPKFAFIATGDVGYSLAISNEERRSNASTIKLKGERHSIGAIVSPGIVYFITPKFGLEVSFGRLGYMHQISNSYVEEVGIGNVSRSNQNSSFHIDLNITSLQIGVMYYFGKKLEAQ